MYLDISRMQVDYTYFTFMMYGLSEKSRLNFAGISLLNLFIASIELQFLEKFIHCDIIVTLASI